MLTPAEQRKIADFLKNHHIPKGLGTRDEACSIAAINLALTGELTDKVPPCMSKVIGRWIICVQDAMPDDMRNSTRWKQLLPLAAGTGRDHEEERSQLILDWMWETVLPSLQPLADENGFGKEWSRMCTEKSAEAAADAARDVARAADATTWDVTTWVAVTWAARAAEAARDVEATRAAEAAKAAATSAANFARAARAVKATPWETFDPCGLLERLVEIGDV